MRIKIILYATIIIVVLCQQYPPCPGASPLDLGNTTDSYNKHILELSSFLHSDDKTLELAFESYLKNGDQSEVTKYMGKQKFFYVIITVSLSLVSLVLFIILLKMGNINFTEKQLFQKIKQKGYSSPISAFFTLSAVILLAFTTFNGFLIPFMISDIKATQCRLDAVSSVFIKGSSQYDWDGIQKYIDKLEILSNFTVALQQSLRNTPNYELTLNYTEFSSIYLKEGLILYKGIKDSYKNSQIVYNSTDSLSLQSLIPNLFVSTANKKAILQDLQFYMSTLTSALDTYKHIQYSLNQSHERLNSSLWFFNKSSLQLNDIKQTYQIVMNNFRARIDPYFSSAQYTLIISEIITAFSFVGCLVSIITIRLIQANFDYFSLRIYKVIWAAHIIVFCLNLVFLLIVNQVLLYSEGACNVSYEILINDTKAQQLIPSIKFYSAERSFYFCVNSSDDFSVQAQIQSDFAHINYLINLKQKLSDDYSINTISSYSSILDSIRINITAYKIGIEGNYTLLDSQLTKMNNILMNDPYNQYCFKHHWQYSPSDCGKNQTTIVLPRYRFPNHLNSSNFGSSRADCYVLSSYDEFRPIFIKQTQFILLYQNYLGYCNNSIKNLAVASDCFFRTQMKKQNILENLISQLSKLENYLYNSSYYIAKFISKRGSFFKKVFQNLSPNTNTLFIKKGNDCGIIHAYVNGIYNQFCVNFRAKGRQIFLITFLNIAFSIFLILLSFLYSLQLRSLNEQSIDLQYSERIKFEKTHHEIQSNSSTSQLKSHSSGSEEHRSG